MTVIPPSSDPPFGADTDEAVSALLDGELGAFAADHATTEAHARTRLEAWPGFEARRTALEAASAAVATTAPALDELTRRRLVANATASGPAAAPSPRRSRVWTAVGAAAVALVVVVGIGLAIDAGDDSSSPSDSASSAGGVTPDLRGDIGNVGDLSGPDALRALLSGERTAKAEAGDARDADNTTGGGGATSDQSGNAPVPATGESKARAVAPPLPPDQCAAKLAGTRPVTFVGTGTYRGVPVTVIGLTEGGRVIAFLVPSNDCTNVLTSVSR
jgi:hypothetical protein